MYMGRTRQLNIGLFVGVIVQHRQLKTSSLKQREDSGRKFFFKMEVSCMSSRAINIGCARAVMSRHSALVMFFYMRLEKHVCIAMSHGLLLHE
jgi:hypothetical protein